MAENHRLHQLMIDGVPVETRAGDGRSTTLRFALVDFERPEANDWLVLNQFTIVENGHNCRSDLLVFLNGLPVALFELKNPADEKATLRTAWNQIQTYRKKIPSVFTANVVTVISDGIIASMSSSQEDSSTSPPGRSSTTGSGSTQSAPSTPSSSASSSTPGSSTSCGTSSSSLTTPSPTRPLDSERRPSLNASPNATSTGAVNAAVESTVSAAGAEGDRRVVVWHTQGSGKSLEMVFYAAKIMRDPRMGNPTLVFITDRNDLDDQLFAEVFAPARLLPETPVQANSRRDLRRLLVRASGGIIFTTLQKFAPGHDGDALPVFTDGRNVVVIADEARRSQYGFAETLDAKGRLKAGLAKHLRRHDIVTGILHGVEYDSSPALPPEARLAEYGKVVDFVLGDEDVTKRYNNEVLALARAFVIVAADRRLTALEDDIRLFIDVRAAILKVLDPGSGRSGAHVSAGSSPASNTRRTSRTRRSPSSSNRRNYSPQEKRHKCRRRLLPPRSESEATQKPR